MVHSPLVKRTSQPLSHILTTESSDWSVRAGMTWPVAACFGSVGQLMVHWCVDTICESSGMVTQIWLVVVRMYFTDACVDMK